MKTLFSFLFIIVLCGGLHSQISIIGTASPSGNWTTDHDLTETSPGIWTGSFILSIGELKFRENNAWTNNWGNTTFPNGTGIPDGPNIPVSPAGTYYITFNAGTLDYSFVPGGNVAIGPNIPHSSAILDLQSITQGFLPPRMTLAQRNAIATPAEGLMISCTDCSTKGLHQYINGVWQVLAGPTPHFIGESYGGGIVFYVYDNGQHGLIAATADQSSGIRWYGGTNTNTRARADGIGAGLKNTAIIIANQGPVDGAAFAATVCNEYSVTVGGVTYGDWYLPSKHELNLLYLQKNVVGGFPGGYYWSSTELGNGSAWGQNFTNGTQATNNKTTTYRVRAVRAF